MQPSASLVAWLPSELHTVMSRAPFLDASSIADRVSAVSPDWPMETTNVLESRMGLLYLKLGGYLRFRRETAQLLHHLPRY